MFDWEMFSDHINKLDPAQVNNLKTLTRDHFNAGNDEKKAQYIKAAYVDNYDGPEFGDAQGPSIVRPRVVLWEVHPGVHGLHASWNNRVTDVNTLKKSLRALLPPELRNVKTEIYFASMQIRDQKMYSEPETLRHYLLSYCDKIYVKPHAEQSNTNTTWTSYKNYFNQAQQMILTNPTLYTKLCRTLKELFSPQPSTSMVISEDKLYSYLVLLRSLPDTVAHANAGYIEAARSLKELFALLDILDDAESALAQETAYNVLNAIEWLTYLIPKMYGALPTNTSAPPLYQEIVERLEKYIVGDRYKLAIRMEAAWALGWASVSSIGVATCVHQYEKSTKSRVYKLHSNVLRHVVGTAYLRASFTLVSFGPARVSSGTVEPFPGAYLPDQMPAQIDTSIHDNARLIAGDIAYNELEQIVGGNISFQLLVAVLAASWLMTNDLITIFFSLSTTVVFWLEITPIFVMLFTMILLTRQWGGGYWRRTAAIGAMFTLLVACPWIRLVSWQQAVIIIGIFTAIVGFLSPWVSVLAVFPGLVRFLRSKQKT